MIFRAIPLVFLVLCAGCSGSGQAPTSPQTSATSKPAQQFNNVPYQANDLRFHWSAAQGIDLLTGPAVAVRAYIESYLLVGYAGGDMSAAYYWFTEATARNMPPNGPATIEQLQHVRPETREELEKRGWTDRGRRYSGYQPIHIQDIRKTSEWSKVYRATICIGRYSVYESVADNPSKFYSIDVDPTTFKSRPYGIPKIEIWRVELTEKDTWPDRFLNNPQSGPLPAPSGDVFSPWFITGASDSYWGTLNENNVSSNEVRQQCENAMPDDDATRRAMATGIHDQPPPHGDPIPGWPKQ